MKTALLLPALVALVALAFSPLPGDNAAADETHDVAVTSIETFGPPAVNLSDTNGRYLWVIGHLANYSDHTEMVNVSLNIPEPVPIGCERQIDLILPGQPSQLIKPGGTKDMYWRVRYECHSPATFAIVRQTITVALTHCDPSTSYPGPVTSPTPGGICPKNSQPAGAEADVSNNVLTAQSGIMVR